ncbi:hypothetical protein SADUNF_Sadunf05G0097100 [Salix dunnii]|uniref:DUF4228 domain protein n=1 Tax=Salix dunnii TaxID=1413687 RepID=A0A835MYX8_9ROSI|nr:hypothetical protein SADUNF_Sadunf05G0097100 [Salix dunnii]
MGICSSCESTHLATAKLILQDGRLQEFSYPVKVSYFLAKNPSYFVCNADAMEFDVVVSAINDDEELQPGQLYFALPLSWLKRPLQPEQMAALAVKASSALMKTGGAQKRRCRKKLVFSAEKDGRGGGPSRNGGRRNKFTAMLSAIPE